MYLLIVFEAFVKKKTVVQLALSYLLNILEFKLYKKNSIEYDYDFNREKIYFF